MFNGIPLLTMEDDYSRKGWAIRLRNQKDTTVVKGMKTLLRIRYDNLLTDNGVQFSRKNQTIRKYCEDHINEKHIWTSVYHPQTMGKLSAFQKGLKRSLYHNLGTSRDEPDIDHYLDWVNTSPSECQAENEAGAGMNSSKPTPKPLGRQILALAGWMLICFSAAAMDGRFIPGERYASLQKPSWNPPGRLFTCGRCTPDPGRAPMTNHFQPACLLAVGACYWLALSVNADSASARTLVDFAGPTNAPSWQVVNDDVMGGVSSRRFSVTHGVAVFRGELSLENNGGLTCYTDTVIPAASNANPITVNVTASTTGNNINNTAAVTAPGDPNGGSGSVTFDIQSTFDLTTSKRHTGTSFTPGLNSYLCGYAEQYWYSHYANRWSQQADHSDGYFSCWCIFCRCELYPADRFDMSNFYHCPIELQ